jgi:hypothetical protein
MEILILFAKSTIAVLLLVAGAAKLSDPKNFAATVRLFIPYRSLSWAAQGCALGIAISEFTLGAASLSFPETHWLNIAIFVLACAFIVVSIFGFAFHRGRPCRCFGALSHRNFDVLNIIRSTTIAAVAAVAMIATREASTHVALPTRVLLIAACLLLGIAASTAARTLNIAEVRGRH